MLDNPLQHPTKVPIEIRRKIFRDLTEDIAKELDARGVKDEDVERDFAAFKKHRR